MKKQNNQGFSHHLILPILVILAVGAIGVYTLNRSKAATQVELASSSRITIASWNTLITNSKKNIAKGATALSASADIIDVQELNYKSERQAIRDKLMCKKCTFTGYMYKWKSYGATPASASIFWNKTKFTKKDAGWLWSYGKAQKYWTVEKDRNAPEGKVASRYITWVRLLDNATGREFYVLNTHTIAAIDKDGTGNTKNPKRMALYKKHMDTVASFIQSIKAKGDYPIFLTGDFNVDYRKDNPSYQGLKGMSVYADFPYAKLTALNMHSGWERFNLAGIADTVRTQGSSGNRIIDYVWSTDHNNVTPISASISSNAYGSDHLPVFYSFDLAR
jgi:endonuclease/exonuclease/phosphatase family metal-dependent hydrolase